MRHQTGSDHPASPPLSDEWPTLPTALPRHPVVADPKRNAHMHLQVQQTFATRKSSLGAVFLTLSGVLALLLQRGSLSWLTVLVWFGRWWPSVLLAAGFMLFVEWALDNYGTDLRPARRQLGALTVVGLICIVILGLAVTTFTDLSSRFLPHTNSFLMEN